MLICLFCILFGFFLTIKHTIDYNYWYNYQYKPKSNSPHPFWSVHSFSPFLLTSPYNLTILQPISKSSRLHKTRFYFTHWASSCILAICFLYHSKLLSGESIRFWFRFVARLLRNLDPIHHMIPSTIIQSSYLHLLSGDNIKSIDHLQSTPSFRKISP